MGKTQRVAVVGGGYWGKNLVRNFHGLQALHTICDVDTGTLEEYTARYPGINTTTCFEHLLENGEIDAIAIATPAETHFDLARRAMAAGKDIFVEKPLALSRSDGAKLVQMADSLQRILMVGHLLWYHPAVLKLYKMVRNGELGRLRYIYSNRLNLGKLRREENVLWSFAPHDISVILGLVDEMPISVQAQGGNYLHARIADTTVSCFRFASGVKAHVFVSWLHPFKEQKLVVVGDRAMAVFDDTAPWDRKLALFPHSIHWSGNIPVADKADVSYIQLHEQEPLRRECAHFIDCIARRTRPRTDAQEGLRVLSVLKACQSAMESKATVALDPASSLAEIHPTAVVDEGCSIGEHSRVWHFSHILSGSTIGVACVIGQNVMIGPNVIVGDRCKIQNNVSVYEGVTLEDEVFCGPSMVFTNVYNPRAGISRKKEFRPILVKKGATLGANCTIVPGVTVGRYAFIGAGALVNRDVPDFALVVGVPARQTGWMSRYGERLELPLAGNATATCPHTHETYILDGATLRLESDTYVS